MAQKETLYIEMMLQNAEKTEQGLDKLAKHMEELSNRISRVGTISTTATKGIDSIGKTLDKLDAGMDKATKGFSGWEAGLRLVGAGLDKTGQSLDQADKYLDQFNEKVDVGGKHARGFSGELLNMTEGFRSVIFTGMMMSVAWQAMNTTIQTITSAVSDLIFAGVQVEAQMASIAVVSKNTGRDLGEVTAMIDRQTDAFADRASVSQATLKLLGSGLNLEQIEKFIEIIKAGSAAMGEQVNVQLPLVAAGFRRHNMNVMDNIGLNMLLDKVQRQYAATLGKTAIQLNNNEIDLAIYNAAVQQSTTFMGAYEAQLNTAQGAMNRAGVSWKKYAQEASSGNTDIIKAIYNGFAVMEENETKVLVGIRLMKEMKAAGVDLSEVQKKLNDLQKEAMAHPGSRTFDLMKEGYYSSDILKVFDLIIQKQEEMTQKEKENTEQLNKQKMKVLEQTDVYNIFNDQLRESNQEFSRLSTITEDYTNLIGENTKQIVELEHGYINLEDPLTVTTLGLYQYRKELEQVTQELDKWSSAQQQAERDINTLTSALVAKQRALHPELYETTEQKYSTAQKEADSAQKDLDTAKERLYQRVEPLIYQKYLSEEQDATEKLNDKVNEETGLKSQLEIEIANLQQQISSYRVELDGEYYSLSEVDRMVTILSKDKEDLSTKISDMTNDVGDLNEANWRLNYAFTELSKEDGPITKVKEKVDELNSSIETLKKNMEISPFKDMFPTSPIKMPVDVTFTGPAAQVINNLKEGGVSYDAYGNPISTRTDVGMSIREDVATVQTNPWKYSKQFGGFIQEAGLYMLHQGEKVTNALDTRNATSNSIVFTQGAIIINAGAANAEQVYREFQRKISTELLRRAAI